MHKRVFLLSTLALVVMFLVAACGGASQEADSGGQPGARRDLAPEAPAEGEASAASGYSDAGVAQQIERMIIWNATVEMRVEDTEQAIAQVQDLARELGGYGIGTESWVQSEQLYARLTIRVPADRFDEAMARLRQIGIKVEHETATSEDVTDEYVDLESRLRHLQAKEAQLTKFMDQAEDTEAVLAVYEQLAATQAEIEQVKGRMTYLEKLSAMATITVQLYPETADRPVVEEGWKPLSTVRNAARSLVATLQGLGDALIWFVISVLPVLVLLALPLVIVVWAIRRWRRGRRAQTAPTPPAT